jgi:hypothetical protein
MNASWSMVFGALLAGLVGGFMIPARPEIRDVPALTAKATEPAKKSTDDKVVTPVAAKADTPVRQIPLTETAAKEPKPDDEAGANSCAEETWPNRSANCLDRTATVAPAGTVPARRIEPKASPQEKKSATTTVAAPEPTPAPTPPAPKAAEAPAPKIEPAKSEPVKSEQKVVTAPPAREERTERAPPPAQAAAPRPAPQTEQAATRPSSAPEPRAQTNDRQEASSEQQPRRAARRTNRHVREDFDDGIPTRIYLRGPDGRLYLAPEHRPSGRQTFYIMR